MKTLSVSEQRFEFRYICKKAEHRNFIIFLYDSISVGDYYAVAAVDSRDKHYNFTPNFVKEAGAKGYETQTGSVKVWSPYPDDPIFHFYDFRLTLYQQRRNYAL